MKAAIITRYIGPTTTRPARIVATSNGNRVIVPYDYHNRTATKGSFSSGTERAHFAAVLELCRKLDWYGKLIAGGAENGYVWVWLDDDSTESRAITVPHG